MWTISAPGIIINNPEAPLMRPDINLVTKQFCNIVFVKCNPWCTYSLLVPKWGTFMLPTVFQTKFKPIIQKIKFEKKRINLEEIRKQGIF